MEDPDLHAPRPLLRIVPGKLAGSPHIVHTRIETLAVDALDLERQLRRNLAA